MNECSTGAEGEVLLCLFANNPTATAGVSFNSCAGKFGIQKESDPQLLDPKNSGKTRAFYVAPDPGGPRLGPQRPAFLERQRTLPNYSLYVVYSVAHQARSGNLPRY